MEFIYQNPVRILFGARQIANLGKEIPVAARILMTYGGGSIKANGVYDQVRAALAGRRVARFTERGTVLGETKDLTPAAVTKIVLAAA